MPPWLEWIRQLTSNQFYVGSNPAGGATAMKKLTIICTLLAAICSSCYAEWDLPKTPRRDPCTGKVESKYVYVNPECHYPAPQPKY